MIDYSRPERKERGCLDVYDDELLAPPYMEEPEETAGIGEPWQLSHGFTDSKQVVRIWVDPQTCRLQRVKLSSRWRDRLGGRSLSDAFLEAYFVAYVTCDMDPPLRPQVIEMPGQVAFRGTLEELQERMQSVIERMQELEARAPENVRWADFKGDNVRATYRGVTVSLTLAGLAERVEFDKKWLAVASESDIAEQVLGAHRIAYQNYTPPEFVPGEREELAAELAFLQAAADSMMTEGIA